MSFESARMPSEIKLNQSNLDRYSVPSISFVEDPSEIVANQNDLFQHLEQSIISTTGLGRPAEKSIAVESKPNIANVVSKRKQSFTFSELL